MRVASLLAMSTLLALLLVALAPPSASTADAAGSATATWTIMMYMADDYSIELPWQQNIAAMMAADQAPGTNVIALVDPPGPGNTMLLQIKHGSNTSIEDSGAVVPPSNEVNMASPDTLQAFVGFATNAFPAEHYVLFLWGHADVWIGLCPDGTDILTLPELRLALEGAASTMGRPLDLIAVDACAEASVETLFELNGLTDYFVASEKDIPFEGLPYEGILNDLAADPGQPPVDLGAAIVRNYIAWSRYNSTYSSAMTVFDMSKFSAFADRLGTLSVRGERYDSLFHGAVSLAFQRAESYETGWSVDCGDLMRELIAADLPPELSLAAMDTLMAYGKMVADFALLDLPDPIDGIHAVAATGAVIYAPRTVLPDTMYANLSIAASPWYAFGRLARHFGPTNVSGDGPILSLVPTADSTSAGISLQWPAGYEAEQAWVFRQEPGGLVPLTNVGTDTGLIHFEGLIGDLVISASASNGTEAVSYAQIETSVAAQVTVSIALLHDGAAASGDYAVKVIVGGTSYDVPVASGHGTLVLIVPSQAGVNDLLQVQVYDKGGNVVVGSGQSFVQTTDFAVSVDVFHASSPDAVPIPVLAIAILPGTLLLVYALLLYRGDRMEKKEQEQ